MNLFEKLVNTALEQQPSLKHLRSVVAKELMHHDIMKVLQKQNDLKNLVFIGGTCLRACYGSIRLSEDLDFTTKEMVAKDHLHDLGERLKKHFLNKYELQVQVSEPKKDLGNVNSWKITLDSSFGKKDAAHHKVHIDICSIKSLQLSFVPFTNHYKIDMGTFGLILQAQMQEEIFLDKLLAFALRPNRIKMRDLWDILWLQMTHIIPDLTLIRKKLDQREIDPHPFLELFEQRVHFLKQNPQAKTAYESEILRFVNLEQSEQITQQLGYWEALTTVLQTWHKKIEKALQTT